MACLRKPLAVACGLNTGILLLEMAAGLRANSLSLVMDAIHNFSDELALIFLALAALRWRFSGRWVQAANGFNSIGLIAVSAFPLWQAVERLGHPQPVIGVVPVAVGLLAALGNWCIALALREPGKADPAIRLAYLHNRGDALVSLGPVVAGLGVVATGAFWLDPLVALGVGGMVLVPALRTFRRSGGTLFGARDLVCIRTSSALAGQVLR